MSRSDTKAGPVISRLSSDATPDQMAAYIARLEAENARMVSEAAAPLKLKVSEKGGLSVYGLGRFPVTLYREQWERLLADAERITAYIAENDAYLKRKGE